MNYVCIYVYGEYHNITQNSVANLRYPETTKFFGSLPVDTPIATHPGLTWYAETLQPSSGIGNRAYP